MTLAPDPHDKFFVFGRIVIPFLIGISFIWDTFNYLALLYRFYIRKENGTHRDRVRIVQKQVKAWRTEGKGRKMCTARPSWKSITQQKLGYKDHMYRVCVDMDNVLEIDEKTMSVTVEPSVSIGFLNRFLVSYGYTLPIVPELDELSIGGLVMGGGVESTSHKYGLFEHICIEFELVTADGEVMVANSTDNPDLFYAVPFSYGTLGFLTAVTIRIMKYKPYIKMTYRPTSSLDETVNLLKSETQKNSCNDSVEGIMFNSRQAVIMTGQFINEDEVDKSKLNRMGLWFKPWFYKHVQSFLTKQGETVEYVPTIHFHQRHNKPCFWLTPLWLPWAHNIVARFLMGWALPINTQLLKLVKEKVAKTDYPDNFILQDFILPIHHLKEAILLSEKMTDVWPVWMVPIELNQVKVHESRLPRGGDCIYVDFGVYGVTELPNYKGRDPTLRVFEEFTLSHGGYQALYAETLMSYEEFAEMFDRTLYEKVRDQIPYCREAFPDTYQKISRAGRKSILKVD